MFTKSKSQISTSTKTIARLTAAFATTSVLAMAPLASGVAYADDKTDTEPPDPATSQTDEQKIAPYVTPSITAVSITWTGWLWDSYNKQYINDDEPFTVGYDCTGYVVNPAGWIATAGHCVEYDDTVKTDFLNAAYAWALDTDYYGDASDKDVASWVETDFAIDGEKHNNKPDRDVAVSWAANVSGIETGDGKAARVAGFQSFDTGDAALLKVEETGLNALPLVPADEELDPMTKVAAIGYPGSVDKVTDVDYTPSVKTGAISSEKSINNGLVSVYEIDAAVSGGMSGGPTVNYDGEVVGTNSFGIADEPQAFNFVGQSDRILELMASNGVVNELSETTQTYRDGIDAYFAGDKATAVASLSAVVDEQPANGIAADYLARAKDLPEPKPAPAPESSSPMIYVAGGVVVVAALVIVGLWVLRRNQGSSPQYPAQVMTSHTPTPAADNMAPEVDQPARYYGFVNDTSAAPTGTQSTVTMPSAPPSAGSANEGTLDGSAGPAQSSITLTQTRQFCPGCGSNAAGGNYCPGCGAAL